jgi:DNA-binding XRE family transcriptional regulator
MPAPLNKERQQEIAARLTMLREILGLSASAMARSIDRTPQAWYSYEIGRRVLNCDVAAALCDAHGVDFNFLYSGGTHSIKSRKLKRALVAAIKARAARQRSRSLANAA